MTLILFHSPKGGVGNTFLAAHCAMEFAARGHETVAIDFTYQASLKLFFGLLPDQPLVKAGDPSGDEMVVAGVELFDGEELGRSPAFRQLLTQSGAQPFPADKVIVADIAAHDRALRQLLMPHAALHVIPIVPRPAALATLVHVDPDTPLIELERTALVLNMLDDTRTLSRHSRVFLAQGFGGLLAGSVRQDECVGEAVATFDSLARLFPHSPALADIGHLAAELELRAGLVQPSVEATA
ncbi:ATPase [Croceibacterium sp. TMG7-5b_MA50]|uniref:nucleotide-binding protein n=1 Tax=Croceibacterium sp. TMG7-5b_MA50 TaxID=3121290 RepID=UPI00322214C2